MDNLPLDVQVIVYDYKYQLEHAEKYKHCMEELPFMCHSMKQSKLNLEFLSTFWPEWYSTISVGFELFLNHHL